MKKLLLLLILFISFSGTTLYAQDDGIDKEAVEKKLKEPKQKKLDSIPDGWRIGGVGNLNFGQTQLINWAPGGKSSVSMLGVANLFAHYKKKKFIWDNNLDLTYGLVKTGDTPVQKTDDRIDLVSKAGFPAFKDVYYSAFLNFRSQMTPTFDQEEDGSNRVMKSGFLSPGYVMIALGLDYKPNNNFNVFLSPVTAKVTVVLDTLLANAGAYGVQEATLENGVYTPGKKVRKEIGAFLSARLRKELVKNVTMQSKIDLFESYNTAPIAIDINWETLFDFKVNKYLSANIFFHVVYDEDIDIPIDVDDDGVADRVGPRTQFKEVFGMGFSYKF